MKMLDRDIRFIRGIGEARAKALAGLGVHTAGDMLSYYPRAYEDRTAITPVEELCDGMTAQFRATVVGRVATAAIPGGRYITNAAAADDSGAVKLVFFNRPYLSKTLVSGREYLFYGKISRAAGGLQAVSPEFEPISREHPPRGRILPVYRLCAGVTRKLLMSSFAAAYELCAAELSDPMPPQIAAEHGLAEYSWAIRNIHMPESAEALERARRRLVFDELCALCTGLSLLRGKRSGECGKRIPKTEPEEFYSALGFAPTNAQRRTVSEVLNDMSSGGRMNRLVQGDVGSGKTAVAAAACWAVMRAGGQAALMAPTEVLAVQHFEKLAPLMRRFGFETALLTGKTKTAERKRILSGLASGEIVFAVGTHALFSEDVKYSSLDIVVCDEQQRFGVGQRAALVSKGGEPHVLVMSATPIPRTLSLILYGDLDVSVIDELPPGRRPVSTYVVGESMRKRVEAFVQKQAAEGRQTYIVCPAIDEDESEELKSVNEYFAAAASGAYGGLKVGMLHGRMTPSEKERAMDAFRKGETDILVSTTVIEVGVDNPNASLMVVENADRFGLSQLHQLRGRVGRGTAESYCILISDRKNAGRLKILTETCDGFKIAEKDLELRGPGEFFGSRQSGIPGLKLADLTGDMALLREAREAAGKVLGSDPELSKPENSAWAGFVRKTFGGGIGNTFN